MRPPFGGGPLIPRPTRQILLYLCGSLFRDRSASELRRIATELADLLVVCTEQQDLAHPPDYSRLAAEAIDGNRTTYDLHLFLIESVLAQCFPFEGEDRPLVPPVVVPPAALGA